MTWFQFKHALSDLRHRRGWYGTYFYSSLRIERRLRERSCRKHGHHFLNDSGIASWKWFCVRCLAPDPHAPSD